MKTLIVAIFFLAYTASSLADDKAIDINKVIADEMGRMRKECAEYSPVLADANIEYFKNKAIKRGVRLADDYRETINKVQYARCMQVKSILLLNEVSETVSEGVWDATGGEELIKKLRKQLILTFGRP